MSVGLKANVDGSGAIQVGGTDAITLSTGLNATFVQNANLPNTFGFKNRIINGAMVIDQRNAGASGTATGVYTVDRWSYAASQASKGTWQQNAAAVTPPVGFTNYLGFTSSSAYTVLTGDYFLFNQSIEGLNISDLAWGTASAAAVTLSFWVRSSLTGTFGGALQNNAANRSYPFTYTISSANTWEQKSVTIAGDQSGTWLTTNSTGIILRLSLGAGATYSGAAGAWAGANYFSATGATSVVGTSGATFYITGVQLEKGTTATSFDYRDYGRELAMCQRYYQVYNVTGANSMPVCYGQCFSTTASFGSFNVPVVFRSVPTLTSSGMGCYNAAAGNAGGTVALDSASTSSTIRLNISSATGLVAGNATGIYVNGSGSFCALSAEL
jgi:hypothetical protein